MRASPARRAAGNRLGRAQRGGATAAVHYGSRRVGRPRQRRAPTKQTWPGAWDVSAAGHFRPDEGLAGGLREIAEELGLTVAPGELVALKRHREVLLNPTGLCDREYQDVYLVHREEPLSA